MLKVLPSWCCTVILFVSYGHRGRRTLSQPMAAAIVVKHSMRRSCKSLLLSPLRINLQYG